MVVLVVMFVLSVFAFPLDLPNFLVLTKILLFAGAANVCIAPAIKRSLPHRRLNARAGSMHRSVGNPTVTLPFVLVMQSLSLRALRIHPALSLDDPSVWRRRDVVNEVLRS